MTGYLPYCHSCQGLTWLVGQFGKRRCAICHSDHWGWVPEPPGPERTKEPMHPHSEDAGQPYNRADLQDEIASRDAEISRLTTAVKILESTVESCLREIKTRNFALAGCAFVFAFISFALLVGGAN